MKIGDTPLLKQPLPQFFQPLHSYRKNFNPPFLGKFQKTKNRRRKVCSNYETPLNLGSFS